MSSESDSAATPTNGQAQINAVSVSPAQAHVSSTSTYAAANAAAPSITTLTLPSIGICQRPPMKIYFSWEPSNLHLRQTSVWVPKYVHYTKNGVDQWYRIELSDRDGSCLFHSFHRCLLEFANIDYAIPGKLLQPGETVDRYLRRVIVEHMKNDLGPYVFWIEAMFNDQGGGIFESAEAYLEHMLDSNEYGGHIEIFVFSQLYNLGVRVLGQEGDAHCVKAESNDSNDSTNMISVLYTGDNDRHYEAAIPIEAAPNATVLQNLQHTHGPNPDTPLGGEEDDDGTAGTINNNDDRDSWLSFSEECSSYSDVDEYEIDEDEDEDEYEIDEYEDEDEDEYDELEDDILLEAEPKKKKRKSASPKKYTLQQLKKNAQEQRDRSGVTAQFSYLNKKGELDPIKCGLLIATKNGIVDNDIISKDFIHDNVSNIQRYTHFSSKGNIMMAKGGLGGVSEYGLITVLNRYPFLKRVHEYILDNYINENSVTSIKFIVHTGQQGMKDDAIILYEDHNEDDPYDYIVSENHTAEHHDYMCHRHGDNGELILGCGNTVKEYKSNTTAQQQNRGRNATLIMNLGHDRTLQIKSCVDDDHHELANITMNHHLTHGDVIAFGTQFNAVATHAVLGGSTGNRISLVYELALHDPVWKGDKTTTFHEHMGVKEGKFHVRPLKQTIKIEQECSSSIPSSSAHFAAGAVCDAAVIQSIPVAFAPSAMSTPEAALCFIPTTVWEQRLQELAAYKEVNGDTNVPQTFPSNKQLGIWVTNQRQQYKLLREGKNSHMTTERIESLNELDFDWSPRNAKATVWEQRLQELAIYKQVNGHTNVPTRCRSNKPLGKWVTNQRQQYKLLREGKNSHMTTERIESLNELDFEWISRNAKATVWEQRLQELATYKQVNGHTNVPTRCKSNKQLVPKRHLLMTVLSTWNRNFKMQSF
jgi:hypothetical protein